MKMVKKRLQYSNDRNRHDNESIRHEEDDDKVCRVPWQVSIRNIIIYTKRYLISDYFIYYYYNLQIIL